MIETGGSNTALGPCEGPPGGLTDIFIQYGLWSVYGASFSLLAVCTWNTKPIMMRRYGCEGMGWTINKGTMACLSTVNHLPYRSVSFQQQLSSQMIVTNPLHPPLIVHVISQSLLATVNLILEHTLIVITFHFVFIHAIVKALLLRLYTSVSFSLLREAFVFVPVLWLLLPSPVTALRSFCPLVWVTWDWSIIVFWALSHLMGSWPTFVWTNHLKNSLIGVLLCVIVNFNLRSYLQVGFLHDHCHLLWCHL